MVKTYLRDPLRRLQALGRGVRGINRNVDDGSKALDNVRDQLGTCLRGRWCLILFREYRCLMQSQMSDSLQLSPI